MLHVHFIILYTYLLTLDPSLNYQDTGTTINLTCQAKSPVSYSDLKWSSFKF